MILDAHTHIFMRREHFPGDWLRDLAWREARKSLPFGDPDELVKNVKTEWMDPDGAKWAKDYEYCGIDISVNMPSDYAGAREGYGSDAKTPIEEINREMCMLAKEYPGKLYSFIGVNPLRRNAVKLLERGVKEWGAIGLKLLPHTGFYPDAPECYRLYEKAAELKIPVTIHTGAGIFRNSKYAHPIHLEQPAMDFRRDLEFIAAHAGGGIGELWEEMCTVARYVPNINLELAQVAPTVIKGGFRGNKGKYKDHIPQFIDILDIMRNTLIGGCANILFASDYPTYPVEVLKEWVDLFKNLPAIAAQYGYDFSQEEADLMCYKNAARIMSISVLR
ncbi:amidohydrolase family protein [Chloroflexota bacterium]